MHAIWELPAGQCNAWAGHICRVGCPLCPAHISAWFLVPVLLHHISYIQDAEAIQEQLGFGSHTSASYWSLPQERCSSVRSSILNCILPLRSCLSTCKRLPVKATWKKETDLPVEAILLPFGSLQNLALPLTCAFCSANWSCFHQLCACWQLKPL